MFWIMTSSTQLYGHSEREDGRMLTQEKVDRFQRDGFLNAGPILSNQEVNRLSDALNDIIAIGPEGFGGDRRGPVLFRDMHERDSEATPVWQIVNMWEASGVFRDLVCDSRIIEAIVQLTGFEDLQVWHDQVQYKPAKTGGATPWHQDAPLWPAIEPMTPVSAWIPLDDAEVENGCMWMVPGSHRWGNQIEFLRTLRDKVELPEFTQFPAFEPPAGAEIRSVEARACPVKRGEVHFHHSLTWHGSPLNRSPRPRRAVAIHYMTGEARFTGRSHVMAQFVEVKPGEPMIDAGEHLPIVARGGQTVTLAG